MGEKSLVVLKTHVGSINISFVNDFVCGNMFWAFGSLRVLICNWVVYLFGFILRYITRFLHVGDEKNEVIVQPSQADSEGNGFSEELASFLFWSEDVYEGGGERETESSVFMDDSEKREDETECSIFMDSHSDIHEDSDETEVYTENSVLKEDGAVRTEEDAYKFTESDSDGSSILEGGKGEEGEMDGEKVIEDEIECSVFNENVSNVYHESIETEEEETRQSVSVDIDSNIHEDNKKSDEGKTESSVLMESHSSFHEDANKKIDENEVELSVFMETEPNVHDDTKKRENEKESKEEEEETEDPFFVETELATSTNKCQYMSGKDTISGFMEETSAMSFSFREFYMGPDVLTFSNNSCTNTKIIADKELSVLEDSEDSVISQEETEYSVPEQVSTPSNTDIPFRFDTKAFGGTDSSDEDDDGDVIFNENSSVVSDSESESSCSSGLIWGNSYKVEDSISYQFLGGKSVDEGFESEILKLMLKEERIEGVFDEKQFSCDEYIEMDPGKKVLKSMKIEHGFTAGVNLAGAIDKDQKESGKHEEKGFKIGLEKSEEAKWEEVLSDSDSNDHDYEDDFEWEHDDLVEQLKLELRNARQGGLATILEEDEDDDGGDDDHHDENMEEEEEKKVMESPKVVEDFEPLKIEERLEYKDQLDEIEKVYKSYAEKMRKLDILNYQTMHTLGLIQLKDPLKLISIPKSTTTNSSKPTIISQNLWPRKSSKNTSDPILKFVHDLQKDLELVYVGQVCLSWEILCWQHMKAQELEQYETQNEDHRYNIVAGEFQLFQVLMQRFIENEPFQGPRIQNYVKNRCVIRNLLQVPAIKDDSMKDRNITKEEDEEVPIGSGRLSDIIKESMRVFWEFLKADKDYGNLFLKVSHQIGNDLKDPAISALLEDIRTQLPKKEKRLKDIVRTGNCIVKKFQKHHEDELDHEQLIAQVGLRLISRVLSTSRLRKEQLIWCHHKLQRITFLNRKIVQVEPSFLLFPC